MADVRNAPLLLTLTYQNVRNATMKVFGFALTMPSIVPKAAVKAMPASIDGSDCGRVSAQRTIGALRKIAATMSVAVAFHATKRACSIGAEYANPSVPARFSRHDMSAMTIANATIA